MMEKHSLIAVFILSFGIPLLSLAQPQVVVVGAGLAGLTTAYRLHEAGYCVHIYEARKRLGGRVFSVEVRGVVEELGGKDITDGGEAESLVSLAQELGLSIAKAPASHLEHYYDLTSGQIIDSDTFEDGFPALDNEMLKKISEIQSRSKNLAEFMDSFFEGYPMRRKIYQIRVRNYQGVEPENLSANEASQGFLDLLRIGEQRRLERTSNHSGSFQYPTLPGGFQFWSIEGGNAKLPEALAKKLPPIHYESVLKEVSLLPSGMLNLVFDHLGQEETIIADQVVLAIPASVFKNINFDPRLLSQDHKDSFDQFGYATVTKVLLPVWNTDLVGGIGTSDHGISWLTGEKSVLTLYYGGNYGKEFTPENLSLRAKEDEFFVKGAYPEMKWPELKTIQSPLDEQFSQYEHGVGLNWTLEPYSLGAYSHLPSHSEEKFEKVVKTCGEKSLELFQPIQNRLFFAGEHTSMRAPSTMEGAVESGERTARMLKQCVRKMWE